MEKTKILQATHEGILKIGDKEIKCAVLEDGTRILTQTSVYSAFDRKQRGRRAKDPVVELNGQKIFIPAFLGGKNMVDYLSEHEISQILPIRYVSMSGRVTEGYIAYILPTLAEIWLKAREDHNAGIIKLNHRQVEVAKRAEMLVRSLARVGITALVDEATGYIRDKKANEYKELFYQFIREDITEKYAKPLKSREGFWNGIYKIYGLKRTPGKNHPQFFGKFLRKYLYAPLLRSNGAILEIIDERNPIIVSKNGTRYRKDSMYQFLEKEVAFEEWKNNLIKIETILEMSPNQRSFESNFAKVFKIDPYTQYEDSQIWNPAHI